jgi:hypothetical protein
MCAGGRRQNGTRTWPKAVGATIHDAQQPAKRRCLPVLPDERQGQLTAASGRSFTSLAAGHHDDVSLTYRRIGERLSPIRADEAAGRRQCVTVTNVSPVW